MAVIYLVKCLGRINNCILENIKGVQYKLYIYIYIYLMKYYQVLRYFDLPYLCMIVNILTNYKT